MKKVRGKLKKKEVSEDTNEDRHRSNASSCYRWNSPTYEVSLGNMVLCQELLVARVNDLERIIIRDGEALEELKEKVDKLEGVLGTLLYTTKT